MPLIGHDNGPCVVPYGVEPACKWLQHNDGTPNDPDRLLAWWNSESVKLLCKGIWGFDQPIDIPSHFGGEVTGVGRLQSVINVTIPGRTDVPAIRIGNMQNCALRNIYFGSSGGFCTLKLGGSGTTSDYVDLSNIEVGGSKVAAAALQLDSCGDVTWYRPRVWNYNSGVEFGTACVLLTGSGGQDIYSPEFHGYVPGGDIMRLQNTGRVRIFGGYIDNNPSGQQGRSYLWCEGGCRDVQFYGTLFGSDGGNPPQYGFGGATSLNEWASIGASLNVSSRAAIFLPGADYRGLKGWWTLPGDPSTQNRTGSRSVWTRCYTRRASLDAPTYGIVDGGQPWDGARQLWYDPPFPEAPSVQITVENSRGAVVPPVKVVAPSATGCIIETDAEVHVTVTGLIL